jgi:hypothetical protein
MNATLSLAWSLMLVTAALPPTTWAQSAERAASGPRESGPETSLLAGAVTREAARLSKTLGSPVTPAVTRAVQGHPSGPSDWSRVRHLAPGSAIIVIVTGAPPAMRYVIAHNDAELTLLNVADPALPTVASDALRDAAAQHPEYFAAAARGETFALGKVVRLGADGVFVADRKFAALTQVVETIGRDDVVEIDTPEAMRSANSAAELGCDAARHIGIGVGAAAFGLIGGLVGSRVSNNGAGLIVAIAGTVGGLLVGEWAYGKCMQKPSGIIYRAP